MFVSEINDIKAEDLDNKEDIKKTTKRVLTTEKEGITNIRMRYFTVEPGGHTPWHKHDWEHENYFVKGKGILVTKEEEIEVKSGMCSYVESQKMHQFKNPYDQPFEFICLIPVSDE